MGTAAPRVGERRTSTLWGLRASIGRVNEVGLPWQAFSQDGCILAGRSCDVCRRRGSLMRNNGENGQAGGIPSK